MDFDFSEAQYELRDEARRFLERECPPAVVRELVEDPSGWSKDLWKQMADLGWMGLPFPEEYGGLGQSFLDLTLVLGELGRTLAPVPYLSSVVLAGQAVVHHGSEEQRRRLLPRISSGDRVAAVVLPDGEGPVVRSEPDLAGERTAVLDAPLADLLVVAAEGPDGPCWFVVEEGFDVVPQIAFDRTRPLGTVALAGVPGERLERPGLQPALRIGVAAVCAEMVGVAERILEMTVAHAKVREQFGRPIGSFQAIKHKCAEMAMGLEASRAAAMYACWAVAADAEDADEAVSVAKSYCSDALGHLAEEAVQVHGGIAYTWEHDMHLYLRRMKSLEALMGDAAFHRERLARLFDL